MTDTIDIQIKLLDHAVGMNFPKYASAEAAGMDLCAALEEPVELPAGERALIPTGLSIALPPGYEAQIRPRSGLALKNGVTILNTPGTVDSDYRGEIKVILVNFGHEAFTIERGMRIAQMVISRHVQASWKAVTELEDTERGAGGFGSTGTRP